MADKEKITPKGGAVELTEKDLDEAQGGAALAGNPSDDGPNLEKKLEYKLKDVIISSYS